MIEYYTIENSSLILLTSTYRDYPVASPCISETLHNLTTSSPRISLYIYDHKSKTKALIKKVKICGPSPWSTLANGMSYSCVQSVWIERPSHKRSWSWSPSVWYSLEMFIVNVYMGAEIMFFQCQGYDRHHLELRRTQVTRCLLFDHSRHFKRKRLLSASLIVPSLCR